VRAGGYEDCKDADIVVLTAAAPMNGETDRRKMQEKTERILADIIPEIMKSGFEGIFLVVSNPVDVMTYLVWKLSGLPYSQVIGTGTVLETARLKNLIGQILDMDPRSVDACVMGEHGDSMMVPWSHVRAGGKEFCDIILDSRERFCDVDLDDLVEQTRKAGITVLENKGNTQYGIASAVVHIVTVILNNENKLIPVSAYLNGEYGVKDVFCGVPAILNRLGVKEVGNFHLTEEELVKFIRSTEKIKSGIKMTRLNLTL
jgi:L-lactate dehydrogenase